MKLRSAARARPVKLLTPSHTGDLAPQATRSLVPPMRAGCDGVPGLRPGYHPLRCAAFPLNPGSDQGKAVCDRVRRSSLRLEVESRVIPLRPGASSVSFVRCDGAELASK